MRGLEILRRHPLVADAALAVGLAAVVIGDVLTSREYLTGSLWIYLPCALAICLPLAARRVAPLPVAAVVMFAFGVQPRLLGSAPPPDFELAPAVIAVYSASVRAAGRSSYLGGAIGLAGGLAWLGLDDFLLPVLVFGGAWFAGRLVEKRQQYADALERERDANARSAAAEERLRLARELHDSVGHSVSVMVVQAGAERLALGDAQPVTREALLAIERTGREALAEMSRLLGLLRKQGEGLALAPRPTLDHAEALVATVRETGLRVELRVEGDAVSLPGAVDVSAYRVLQEALTNVVKHAGPARATAVVRYGRRAVEIEVSDDGRGANGGVATGFGLAGMRERVELHGGTLDTGAPAGGGFVVKARIPYDER